MRERRSRARVSVHACVYACMIEGGIAVGARESGNYVRTVANNGRRPGVDGIFNAACVCFDLHKCVHKMR